MAHSRAARSPGGTELAAFLPMTAFGFFYTWVCTLILASGTAQQKGRRATEVLGSEAKPIVVSSLTTPVEITVDVPRKPEISLWRVLQIDKRLGLHSSSRSRAEIIHLPITLSVIKKEPDLWLIEFPANVLNLLGKDRLRTAYSGKLVFEELTPELSPRSEIPIKLTIGRREVKGKAPEPKKPKVQSAG
jgi:hypothetical protein